MYSVAISQIKFLPKKIVSNIYNLNNCYEETYQEISKLVQKSDSKTAIKIRAQIINNEPILKAKEKSSNNTKVIYMTPQGEKFSQKKSKSFSKEENLIFICGRYEGIDQRIIDNFVDEEISIGDYVLTGGEIPALVVFDAVVRNIEGVLGDIESAKEESHSNEMIEYPQYTRPEKSNLGNVPEVLISGNHKKIYDWRRKQSLGKTFLTRPDIFKSKLDKKDFSLLEEFLSDLGYESDRIADLIQIYKKND